jgi:branched-chain amino acid transport system substrate-binding protein
VNVGAIADISGLYASATGPFADGVEARIDYQNAQGGVNGRKINLSVADDQSTTTGNLAASQQLVEARHVVGIISGSSFTAGGGSYLKSVGLPVVGYASTLEFQTDPNFISNTNAMSGPETTTDTSQLWGEFLKSKGATTVYSVGSGDPQGAAAAEALIASSQAVGLKEGVLTTDLPIGTTNFTSEAVKAKQAGVDTLALPLNLNSSIVVIQAMRQAGVNVKVALLMAGYDPSVAKTAGSVVNNATFAIPFAPFELNLPAQQTYEQALAKYTKGTVGMFTMEGWLAADLMVTGIQKAGACPTSVAILNAIRGLRGYDADGLQAPTSFNTPTGPLTCDYFVTVTDGALVPDNSGKPICATNPAPVKI